ncbi:MAG TPA: MobF family relaxase, partial [Acidimicrobiia bacterium]|nr:MobF family relaxase [Acidimicrobiia bacterium]
MVAAGENLAFAAFLAAATGGPESMTNQPPDSYLVPRIDPDGSRWIADRELSRCEEARADRSSVDRVEGEGAADDELALGDVARLAGVTPRYLRSLCCRYQAHRDEIAAVVAAGGKPKRAYLVGRRDPGGNWVVRRCDLVEFLRRRRVPAVRVGYDVTLTTEKSLGVLALLGDRTTRAAVLDAIQAGNDAGLAYLETHAAWARAKDRQVGTRGWTVASFQHLTSRALDPFPHHHNVVANTVVDEHGTRRALWAPGIYWHATEASALATAEMRFRLTGALGVRWRPAPHGGWEIDGITDEVLREFSQRRNDIEDAVAELEEAIGRGTTIDELQAVVTATRPSKQDAEVEELTRSWWQRARKLGLTPRRLAALTGREATDIVPPSHDDVFSRLAAPGGLCAHSSIFTRGDVLTALVNFATVDRDGREQPLLLPAVEFEELADEFLSSEHAIELIPSPSKDAPVPTRLRRQGIFTTPEMLAVQRQLVEWYLDGLDQDSGVVSDDGLHQALASHPELTGEQRDLVTAFCSSGHRMQCGVGRAGAGKTTTMRAAVEAWEAAGYEVRGTAVKGEAARVLGTATGIRSETLAWYLVQDDPERTPLTTNTVLIVDEASTVPDRDLHKLLHLAGITGATVRLIGDPAQHGAVGAGGMFRVLCERAPEHTPELAASHRLRDPRDAAAADALRAGRVEEAIGHLATAGHLHIVESEMDLHLELLRRWWDSRQAGTAHPMVDRRNRTRRHLNRLAHRLLQVAGEVDGLELAASGGRAFAAGDRVIARMTNRELHPAGRTSDYVRNGATGTVMRIRRGLRRDGDHLTVAFDGIGTIDIPRAFFDHHQGPGKRTDVGIDHAYALTSYAVQGATFGASASRVDEHATRAETYVDITRGQIANHLYVTRAVDPLDGERLPKAPPP